MRDLRGHEGYEERTLAMQRSGLAASYGRRALYSTLGAAAVGVCLLAAPRGSYAQDPPAVPPAATKDGAKSAPAQPDPAQSKTTKQRKPAPSTIKIVPVPRSTTRDDAQDDGSQPPAPASGQAAPQGGNTTRRTGPGGTTGQGASGAQGAGGTRRGAGQANPQAGGTAGQAGPGGFNGFNGFQGRQ